jgi:hypothetical protein
MWRGSKTNGRAAKFIGFLEAAYPAILEGFFSKPASHPKNRRLLMNDWANFCTGASKKPTKRKQSTRHERRQPDHHPFQ